MQQVLQTPEHCHALKKANGIVVSLPPALSAKVKPTTTTSTTPTSPTLADSSSKADHGPSAAAHFDNRLNRQALVEMFDD